MIDRLCEPCWTPPDYLQTDNSNGLAMVIRNYHWLNSASRVLLSTCSPPLVEMGERKQFSLFDLDLWPTTLTYNPRLAEVKFDPHVENRRQTVQIGEHPQTNRWADATKRIIAPATRSIIITTTIFMVLSSWLRAIVRVHPVHLMDADWALVAANPQTKPIDLGCESADNCSYHPHPPSSFIIII